MTLKNPKTDGFEHLADEEPQEDLMGVRFTEVDGKDWRIEAVDPYALWRIVNPHGGKLPEMLQGHFTSPHEAEQAIRAHFAAKKLMKANASTTSKSS